MTGSRLIAAVGIVVLGASTAACASDSPSRSGTAPTTASASRSTGGQGRAPGDPAVPSPPPPGQFVDTVDNPWMPWQPGTRWVFRGRTADGTERTVVTVTDRTQQVQGVACVVVHDVVHVDGALLEDTRDWYAQDRDGNVWYFGEDTKEHDGAKVDTSGSWEAGVDGAVAGIAMKADPRPGDRYFQEYFPGEALDQGKVLATDAKVHVPYGDLDGLLKTYDFTRLEPNADEHKYYAKGIGVVLEDSLHEQDRTALVSMTRR